MEFEAAIAEAGTDLTPFDAAIAELFEDACTCAATCQVHGALVKAA